MNVLLEIAPNLEGLQTVVLASTEEDIPYDPSVLWGSLQDYFPFTYTNFLEFLSCPHARFLRKRFWNYSCSRSGKPIKSTMSMILRNVMGSTALDMNRFDAFIRSQGLKDFIMGTAAVHVALKNAHKVSSTEPDRETTLASICLDPIEKGNDEGEAINLNDLLSEPLPQRNVVTFHVPLSSPIDDRAPVEKALAALSKPKRKHHHLTPMAHKTGIPMEVAVTPEVVHHSPTYSITTTTPYDDEEEEYKVVVTPRTIKALKIVELSQHMNKQLSIHRLHLEELSPKIVRRASKNNIPDPGIVGSAYKETYNHAHLFKSTSAVPLPCLLPPIPVKPLLVFPSREQ
eukprot:PhF_6_TR28156/c0_g1_i2/m.41709